MNLRKSLMVIIAVFTISTMFTACKDDVKVTGVSVDPTTMTLEIGQTGTITATVTPSDADDKTVSWVSSNTDVATVANGVVTAKTAGPTIIACITNDGAKTATTAVTVKAAGVSVQVTGVSVDPTTMTLKIGQTGTITATVTPSDADDKTVSWGSSDTDVATVANGVVTAKAAGTTTITCTTNDGGKTATTAVTVKAASVDDYATLVIGDYSGSITMAGETVVENTTVGVAYDSKNKVAVSVDDNFYIAQMGQTIPMTVNSILSVTKEGDNYKATGTATATMMGLPLPVTVDATFTPAGALTMNIDVTGIPGMGTIHVIFTGTR